MKTIDDKPEVRIVMNCDESVVCSYTKSPLELKECMNCHSKNLEEGFMKYPSDMKMKNNKKYLAQKCLDCGFMWHVPISGYGGEL